MTKPLDPDLKAIRAINRALKELPDTQSRKRVLEWAIAYTLGFDGWRLPEVHKWRNWQREGKAA